jgi:diacylglycerol kinase (ATP)
MMMQRTFVVKTLFIVNPTAGRGKTETRWIRFEQLLRQRANFPFEVHYTSRSREAETVASEAVRTHFERVIAVGGDGTVNEVMNGVFGSDVIFGILPFGTGNDLARSTGIQDSDDSLLNMLCYPEETYVNVANVNGRHFIIAAGIGFDGIVADYINRHKVIKRLGALGYALGAMTTLRSFTPGEVTLNIDGHCTTIPDVWMIAIGNCPYFGGGMKICPSAKYDDDLLDVCIVSKLGKARFIKLFPSVYSGKHVEQKSWITTYTGKRIEIICPEYMIAHADGELIDSSSLQVHLCEQRIRFLKGL